MLCRVVLRCVPSLSLSWHFPPIHTHTDRQTQQTSVLSTGPSLRLVRTLPSCLLASPCRCADVWTLRLRFFRYRYECVVIPSPFALRASFAGTCPSPPLCRATHICPICSPLLLHLGASYQDRPPPLPSCGFLSASTVPLRTRTRTRLSERSNDRQTTHTPARAIRERSEGRLPLSLSPVRSPLDPLRPAR